MCTRFALHSPLELLQRLFGFGDQVDVEPRYNIAPGREVLALVLDDAGEPHATQLHWGLVPHGASHAPLVNVRAESADVRPSFRNAAAHRRALVLADGFYEWRPEGSRKQPYLFEMPDHAPFGMAALYWPRAETRQCALLTMDAMPVVEPIHDRMPIVIRAPEALAWLSGEGSARDLIQVGQTADLTCRAIDPVMNDVRREGPDLIRPPRQGSLL